MNMIFFLYALISMLAHGATQVFSSQTDNRLITEGFGIVTEKDLTFDRMLSSYVEPYDANKNLLGQLYWQCLPTKDVKPKYHYWRDEDGLGLSGVIIALCDVEIIAKA